MPVSFEGDIVEGRFLDRPNRFIIWLEVGGERVKAHCPTSGRIGELTWKGNRFLARKRPDARADQATQWSIVAGWHDGTWVVVDTHMVNRLVADALGSGLFDEVFDQVEGIQREPAADQGRFDFALVTPGGRVMVEAKSVTLLDEEDGATGRFPDAPTERGTRHVSELADRADQGLAGAVLFVAMRDDIRVVAPNRATDPAFADALSRAVSSGVSVVAWGTSFDGRTIRLGDRLPVALER